MIFVSLPFPYITVTYTILSCTDRQSRDYTVSYCHHICEFRRACLVRFACDLFGLEAFHSPPANLTGYSRYGSTYYNSQEQTEGEGDAHPLSVNRYFRTICAPMSLIFRVLPVGSTMVEKQQF